MKRKTILSAVLLALTLIPLSARLTRSTLTEDQKVLHLLNRIAFGPRPGDVERVRKMGIDKYIDQQLHPERIDDSSMTGKLAAFPSIEMDNARINQKYVAPMELARQLGLVNPRNAPPNPPDPAAGDGPLNNPAINPRQRQEVQAVMQEKGLNPPQKLLQELQGQKLVRAVSSERQLEEVMTDFWYNHFNIFWGKGADKQLTTTYEMDAIRPHVLGKFKDLVMATAKSPAMLFYLDNAQSSSPDMKNQAQLRLQQARLRQQQLARRGILVPPAQIEQMNQRMQQAANNSRKAGINENYARELMELHTMGVDGGYTQKDVQEVARAFTGWTIDRPRQNAGFIFRDAMHDKGEKVVLGHTITAGGIRDAEEVIDILVHHPSTAHFIATKLVRRFVSDEPPAALVDRVASVYMKTDGDIREMLRTILTSDEFYSPDAYRAKTKSQFELVVSSIRALGGETNGAPRLAQEVARMGATPLSAYQAPTGFPDRASQWITSGSLVERLNFGVALGANRIPGTTIDLKNFPEDSGQPDRVVDRAVQVLLGGDVSDQTKKILLGQIHSTDEPPIVKAFAMVLGSPEFQKR